VTESVPRSEEGDARGRGGEGAADDEARAYVGLGGNLGDRLATLRSAVRALGELPGTRVVAASAVYETRPVGPSTEPFLNAAVELRTRLSPEGLLEALLGIEARHGRERRRRWDARTLDLDLLLYLRAASAGWEPVQMHVDGLTLPHPRLAERDFVLVPLRDLLWGEAEVNGRGIEARLAEMAEDERTILRRALAAGGLLDAATRAG
jgi:2-amino-4-hydroxy-6-hydroxymethyldihydropteridine diphosphokinase